MSAVHAYMRDSTALQDDKSQCHALERRRHRPLVDRHSNTDRPALQELLATLRRGDTLVCYKLDRISRSVVDLLGVAERLTAAGVELIPLPAYINVKQLVAKFEKDLDGEIVSIRLHDDTLIFKDREVLANPPGASFARETVEQRRQRTN